MALFHKSGISTSFQFLLFTGSIGDRNRLLHKISAEGDSSSDLSKLKRNIVVQYAFLIK